MDLLEEYCCPDCGGRIGHTINCSQGTCSTKGVNTMATKYEVQIKYPNKEGWHPFFSSHKTMTMAAIAMIRIKDRFPHNKFRVEPVAGKV
jgi:hypothetical protein